MHQVAAIVESWQHQQRVGAVARVIGTDGLGPQRRDELILIDGDGRCGGTLLGGALQPELVASARTLLGSGHTHTARDTGPGVRRCHRRRADLWRHRRTSSCNVSM